MKKRLGTLILAGALAFSLYAQNQSESAAPVRRYELIAGAAGDPGTDTEALRRELELRFDIFNRLFRFDPAGISLPLRVRLFRDQAAYDGYVSARLGGPREGAVYLHYNQSERRELVIHQGSPAAARMLPAQAFLQYLRAFIPSPPTWMKEGFTVYFTTLAVNAETGELSYEENVAWLETVKSLGKIELQRVLAADEGEPPQNLQPLSWSLVSFLLNSGSEGYFRSLTDSFMLLASGATAAETPRRCGSGSTSGQARSPCRRTTWLIWPPERPSPNLSKRDSAPMRRGTPLRRRSISITPWNRSPAITPHTTTWGFWPMRNRTTTRRNSTTSPPCNTARTRPWCSMPWDLTPLPRGKRARPRASWKRPQPRPPNGTETGSGNCSAGLSRAKFPAIRLAVIQNSN
ncbi:MAG: hypothetical protein LBT11_05055 [Treponema sp.]|nr:hypothetical protein [Treponema sp.]